MTEDTAGEGSGLYRISDLPAIIASRITVNPRTGCWEWQGKPDPKGYGRINAYVTLARLTSERSVLVHRVVYALLVGPISGDLTIDHVRARGCESKLCCWPAHLEPVTAGENTSRRYEDMSYCGNGHRYTPQNVRIRANGTRACKACQREYGRLWDQRKRQQRQVGRDEEAA